MTAPAAIRFSGRDHEGAFALFEAIVALAVLAAFSVLLARSVSGAGEAAQRSHDWVMARLVAEAVLAEAFSGPRLPVGSIEGVHHGRHWTAIVRPYGGTGRKARNLLAVHVTVEVAGSVTLSLDTLRVGAPQ